MTLALILARLLSADPAIDLEGLHCMAEIVYIEARGEPDVGQLGVAQLIQNRIESPGFPKTACAVAHHPKAFSAYWDCIRDDYTDKPAYGRAFVLSAVAALGLAPDVTDGAVFYHETGVSPYWVKGERLVRTVTIYRHRFYVRSKPNGGFHG